MVLLTRERHLGHFGSRGSNLIWCLTRGHVWGRLGLRPGFPNPSRLRAQRPRRSLTVSVAMAGTSKFSGFEGKEGTETPLPEDPVSTKLSLTLSDSLVKAGEAYDVDSTWVEALANKLGEVAENIPLKIFMALTSPEFAGVVDDLEVPGKEAGKVEKLSLFQRLWFRTFFEDLKKYFAPAPSVPAATAAAADKPVEPEGPKGPQPEERKFAHVIDQSLMGSFKERSKEEILALRGLHRDSTGGDPDPDERPTAAQISAMVERLEAGKPPYADFAVWGPFGDRTHKQLQFAGSVPATDADGNFTLAKRQIRGPNNLGDWLRSWRVFRAAAIMTGRFSASTLDLYSRGIAELMTYFGDWAVVAQADEAVRCEEWALAEERYLHTPPAG